MKENIIRGALAALLAGTAAYFRQLAAPLAVLAAVMLGDYVTGMMSAWASRTLSSKTGLLGLLKKLGCVFGVGVAVAVDFVVHAAGATLGAQLQGVFGFGLLVTFWLILNECISILENLSELGVPVPGFLRAAAARLKNGAEGKSPLFEKGGAEHSEAGGSDRNPPEAQCGISDGSNSIPQSPAATAPLSKGSQGTED